MYHFNDPKPIEKPIEIPVDPPIINPEDGTGTN